MTTDSIKKLYIEPTSRCNLNCTMCFRKNWFDEAYADMDIVTFENAMNYMPDTVETVFFGGMGEPLFHKDIIYMIRKASSTGKRVELITNATLLDENMSSDLLDAGLNKLWVSLDSFEKDNYEDIRVNSNYTHILTNIANFNKKRISFSRGNYGPEIIKSCELGIAFVAMKSNISQLKNFSSFALKYMVDDLNISNMIPTNKESIKEILYERLLFTDLMSNKQSSNIKVSLPLMDFKIRETSETLVSMLSSDSLDIMISGQNISRQVTYCKFIEEGMVFIKHDGNIVPCMALLHNSVMYLDQNERKIHHHSFGNINKNVLIDIWQNEEYSAFRKRVKDFDFSPCIRCNSCDYSNENIEDCIGSPKPTCGACLWSEGIFSCP